MQMNEEGEKNEKENDDILGVDLFTTAYRRYFLIFSSRANPGEYSAHSEPLRPQLRAT